MRWARAARASRGSSTCAGASAAHPLVTLVGKGVCFDTGGLDIKPSSGMMLMKKDMGGAALVLALARMLMGADAPVQLRLLIPAVENRISGRSFRPSDVLRSRQGLTVEIGNTDAEGRLVLADALTEADREQPALLIDLATLTGAARVALGPELPAIYSTPAELAEQLRQVGEREADPMWPMPLWPGYDEDLGSRVADLNNVSTTQFAGSIIGALFLKRFVTRTRNWLHGDVYAWNPKERPGPAARRRSAYRARAVPVDPAALWLTSADGADRAAGGIAGRGSGVPPRDRVLGLVRPDARAGRGRHRRGAHQEDLRARRRSRGS